MSTKKKYFYAGFGTWKPENTERSPQIVQISEVFDGKIEVSYEWNILPYLLFQILDIIETKKEEEKKNEH